MQEKRRVSGSICPLPLCSQTVQKKGNVYTAGLISSLTLICVEWRRWGTKRKEPLKEREQDREREGGSKPGVPRSETGEKEADRLNDQ